MDSSSDSKTSDMTDTAECGAYRPEVDDHPVPLTQAELNNLTQDFNLSRDSSQMLGFSSLSETSTGTWNNILLVSGTRERI